jgi:ABC-type molybdate transport system substrate-binding protein
MFDVQSPEKFATIFSCAGRSRSRQQSMLIAARSTIAALVAFGALAKEAATGKDAAVQVQTSSSVNIRAQLLSGAPEQAVCFGLPPVGHPSYDSGQPQSACGPSTLFSSNLPVFASTPTSGVTPPFLISKEYHQSLANQ